MITIYVCIHTKNRLIWNVNERKRTQNRFRRIRQHLVMNLKACVSFFAICFSTSTPLCVPMFAKRPLWCEGCQPYHSSTPGWSISVFFIQRSSIAPSFRAPFSTHYFFYILSLFFFVCFSTSNLWTFSINAESNALPNSNLFAFTLVILWTRKTNRQ